MRMDQLTDTLRDQIRERRKELQGLDAAIRDQETMRGLTRGNLMICLRRVRVAREWSLRDLAELLNCSAPMLHDMENGRRWSDDIVARYAMWATGDCEGDGY